VDHRPAETALKTWFWGLEGAAQATLLVHFSYTYLKGLALSAKLLSRKEELLLLAVWKLQDAEGAYGVTIRQYIERMTGISWLFGAIYSPLARLVRSGLVEACESDPLPERGGRRKVLYRLTEDGKNALLSIRELSASFWKDAPSLIKGHRS
jgi:PadR family transcriptional regulator PadR